MDGSSSRGGESDTTKFAEAPLWNVLQNLFARLLSLRVALRIVPVVDRRRIA
jgi:hypothetical protein